MEITTTLVPCPSCKAPLVLIDGKSSGLITFFIREGQPAMTAHLSDCENRGKETPKE